MTTVPGIKDEDFAPLLAGAKAGSNRAVARLFADMQPRLLRFLCAADAGAGEDLAAEVWVAVASSIKDFEGGYQGFRSWVFSIARRRLIDHRRRTTRRKTDPAEEDVFAIVMATDQPDLEVVEGMSGEDAARLLARLLPVDQAEVVLLRVLGDLDVSDVADIMQRTENWVRVTQHRALRKLSARLETDAGAIL